MSPYRLVALDLDGTLLDPQSQITPRTLSVLHAVHQLGIEIILCTGRTLHKALEVLTPIQFPCLLALHNGALLIDYPSGRQHLHRTLPETIAAQALTWLEERDLQTACYVLENSGCRLYHLPHEPNPGMNRFLASKQSILVPYESVYECLTYPILHLVAVDCEERIAPALNDLRRLLPDATILASGGFYGSRYWFLEVLAADASKSGVIRSIAAERGIPREAVLAIGDNYNDLDMLHYAGTGVAMGNAPVEIQAEADQVTASHAEEGVAEILERLVLQRSVCS